MTFLISSHLLDELGKIATNYGIVSNGALVEEITAEELKKKCETSLVLKTDQGSRAEKILREAFPALRLETAGNTVSVPSAVKDASELNRILVQAGVRVYEMKSDGVGFEEFFIERIGK